MSYRAVLFDLDGTLLNTLPDLADATNYALQAMGFPERSMDEVRRFVGNGVGNLIARAVPCGTSSQKTEETLAVFRAYYQEHAVEKTAPYEGILEMLQALSGAGLRMAVVSNKFDAAVKALNARFFYPMISTAIGETPQISRKPAPDSVFAAMRELGVEKEDCVYVGDSEVDVETARNAGIPCIGCAWGFRGRELLEVCGAACVIDDPSELTDMLVGDT